MERAFNNIRKNRLNFLELVSELSNEKINEIPDGFNNNLIWNLGHIIASQQILCYEFSNNAPVIEEAYISKYRRGTKPGQFVNPSEFEELASYLIPTIDKTEDDLRNDLFINYSPRTLYSGIELITIDDAIRFTAVHDGMHFGYAMAIKRILQ
jgi:hypothetical protein